MKSYIHLIRHGITQGILEGWYYGALDLPVVDVGFKEIQDFKDQNIYPHPEYAKFYTSGMLRANQTLKYIYGEVNHEEIFDLRELNFGDWEGQDFEALERLPQWKEWMDDREGNFAFPGGGDSATSFYSRIVRGFIEVKKRHEKRGEELKSEYPNFTNSSVIVCHGGTISAIMDNLFPGQGKYLFDWCPKPARGYTIEFYGEKAVGFTEI